MSRPAASGWGFRRTPHHLARSPSAHFPTPSATVSLGACHRSRFKEAAGSVSRLRMVPGPVPRPAGVSQSPSATTPRRCPWPHSSGLCKRSRRVSLSTSDLNRIPGPLNPSKAIGRNVAPQFCMVAAVGAVRRGPNTPLARRVRMPPDHASSPLLARTLGKGPGGPLFPASGLALPRFAHNWPLTSATHTRKRRLPRVRGASTIRASNCPSGRTDAGICNPDMASPPCKSSGSVHRVGPSTTPAESTGAAARGRLLSNIPADTTGARIRQTAG